MGSESSGALTDPARAVVADVRRDDPRRPAGVGLRQQLDLAVQRHLRQLLAAEVRAQLR